MSNNIEIRMEMAKSGLKQWQVAERLGLSESGFSRLLRKELSDEEKQKIIKCIQSGTKKEV